MAIKEKAEGSWQTYSALSIVWGRTLHSLTRCKVICSPGLLLKSNLTGFLPGLSRKLRKFRRLLSREEDYGFKPSKHWEG